ncbi:unnamed protein product [Trifolium pratense]|uniref:Uncharacterized protein n=1 Tax=Trifolium pratense TaxID=57577 RepID=A0ACB0IIT3_TRIPR|nr:unnamed protein product [Trifolium pratense]
MNGLYSVKSGYNMVMNMKQGTDDNNGGRDWFCVWNAHVPPKCDTSIQSWQTEGLWPQIRDRVQRMNSAIEVVLDICSREVEAVVNRFMIIVWGLWHNRNEWIWNQKQMNPDQINHWTKARWSEWNAAQQRRVTADATEYSSVHRRWVKPITGELKCNVDAAFHHSIDKTSYGCCLRDSNGDFIQALSGWCNPELSVCEGEALGMWQLASHVMGSEFGLE